MKKWMCFVAGILVAAIVITAGFLICVGQWAKPGVHVFGRWAHIDIQQECFFVESDSGRLDNLQVVGQSVFTAVGYVKDKSADEEAGTFEGHMSVESHPANLAFGRLTNWGSISKDFITLSGHGAWLTDLPVEGEYYYIVWILRADPSVIMIEIVEREGNAARAVSGTSEEDALANYKRFFEEGF